MSKIDEYLDDICALKDNWNGNGAEAFEPDFIARCRILCHQLYKEPFIAPTACNSIQLEYDEKHGYLEFELFEDKIYVFQCNNENNWISEILSWFDIEKINDYIQEFFI